MQPLTRHQIAWRAAQDLREGSYVNLGLGLPVLVANYKPADRDLMFHSENGIVGIGMGGSEHRFPPEPFAQVYEKARQLGFKTSVHAGEASGAKSVKGAIDTLLVDRIGHATHAEEDPELLEVLAQRQIPLELCPMSNVATAVIPSLAEHPVRRYWDIGLLITINTDDPGMFHNRLADEYLRLSKTFGFT